MIKREILRLQIKEKLNSVFGVKRCEEVMKLLDETISEFEEKTFIQCERLNEKRAYLIAYGDSIYDAETKEPTLRTLKRFADDKLKGIISDIHILPMFSYTSDDGFSVIDYLQMNPAFGDWKNLYELQENFSLMYDFVANHLSKSSDWFQRFLNEEDGYKNAFIKEDAAFDTSNVTRPRTSPLFHSYKGKSGMIKVWTTFSEDQVDVNFNDPETFARLTKVLLTYCLRGAASIRLDAIGFLWKCAGTSCMSLPQTHTVIEVWRLLVDYFAPNTQIITETNVPHEENISYFGDGKNEANQVYQFALPPLVLHTFTCQNTQKLKDWAKTIQAPSDKATFFNFLASHDGIGMRPVETILTKEEKQVLIDKVMANGGQVSYKANTDGSKSVYELNINYAQALRNAGENDALLARKVIAAHNILLSVVGVPAIYYHSLLGSGNDIKGMQESGIARRINREKLELHTLLEELETNAFRKEVFESMGALLMKRKKHVAFHPYGKQEILPSSDELIMIRRVHDQEEIISYTNVSAKPVSVMLPKGYDLITEKALEGSYAIPPYGIVWLKVK